MVGGVESPQGIDTPIVDELPWVDETPRVATEGEVVTEEDGQGQGGYENPLTIRASKEIGADGGNEGMARGPSTVAPPLPHRDMATNDNSAVPHP